MIRRTLIALGLGAALAAPLQAQETRADIAHGTHPILQRLTQIGDKPFECNLNLDFQGDDGETAAGTATFAFASKQMFALEMQMTVNREGQDEDGTAKVIAEDGTFKVIADGEYVTVEMNQGDQPSQAFKLSMEMIEKMMSDTEEAAMPGMPNPMTEITKFLNQIDFEEAILDGGKITRFAGKIDPSQFPAEYEFDTQDIISFKVDFETATGFPRLLSVTGENGPKLKLSTSNVGFPESIPASRFAYTAPEGVFVMDLTPMFQMQAQITTDESEF